MCTLQSSHGAVVAPLSEVPQEASSVFSLFSLIKLHLASHSLAISYSRVMVSSVFCAQNRLCLRRRSPKTPIFDNYRRKKQGILDRRKKKKKRLNWGLRRILPGGLFFRRFFITLLVIYTTKPPSSTQQAPQACCVPRTQHPTHTRRGRDG